MDQHLTARLVQRLALPADFWQQSRLRRAVNAAFPVVIGALVIQVFLETWIQELLSDRATSDSSHIGLPEWPKDVKNGLLLLLAAIAITKVAIDRRWHEFRTRADIAIVVLGLVLRASDRR